MKRFSGRIERLPLPIRLFAVAVVLGTALLWGLTYSGPYRWFAELQLSLFDGYFMLLTVLLAALPATLAVRAGLELLAAFWPESNGTNWPSQYLGIGPMQGASPQATVRGIHAGVGTWTETTAAIGPTFCSEG